MSTTSDSDLLPLVETVTPKEESGVVEVLQSAYESVTPVYPIGGATSLDYGLPAKTPGIGLTLTGIKEVVDYPARDMTITVGAGIAMDRLRAILAEEGQCLPIDAPQSDVATLGGVVATNTSGPRRYGQGTIRDYVIGISAVDGRGTLFHGGGRVVKNVAGYDFCKLLAGSLGTIGVITQLTLKVRPLSETSALLACEVSDASQAETLLSQLVKSEVRPTAVELLLGPAWQDDERLPHSTSSMGHLVVGLEGTELEVNWMREQLETEWNQQEIREIQTLTDQDARGMWAALTKFPATNQAPLVIKVNVLPSMVVAYVERIRALDPQASIEAHAGNGVIVAHLSESSLADLSKTLIGDLQPAAARGQGQVVVLRASTGDLTRQAVWGRRGSEVGIMEAIRLQFDPKGLLNPGRFVY